MEKGNRRRNANRSCREARSHGNNRGVSRCGVVVDTSLWKKWDRQRDKLGGMADVRDFEGSVFASTVKKASG